MFKNSHFTKPMRTTLFVALILVLIALLSVAFVAPHTSYAADNELHQEQVDQFSTFMEPFVTMSKEEQGGVTKANFYKKDGDNYVYAESWSKYFAAKTLYIGMNAPTKGATEKLTDAWAAYGKLDSFLKADYDLYVANRNLYYTAHPDGLFPATYTDEPSVKEVEDAKKKLYDKSDADSKNEQALLNKVTDDWNNMTVARTNMNERKKALDNLNGTLIAAIEYFDAASKEMKTGYTEELAKTATNQIVYDSTKSIEAVEADIAKNKFIVDEKATNPKSELEWIPNYKDYVKARNELNKQIAYATAVVELIDTAQTAIKTNGYIYTNYKEIDAASAGYIALNSVEGGHQAMDAQSKNHNDLALIVNATKIEYKIGAFKTPADTTTTEQFANVILNEMTKLLGDIRTAIEGVESEITKIGDKGVQPDYSDWAWEFTTDWINKVTAARQAFDKLPKDVQDHDNAEYKKGKGAQYWVEGYGKLCDAEAQYAAWEKAVNDIKAAIKDAVSRYIKGENVLAELTQIFDTYTNMTQDQKNILSSDEPDDLLTGVEGKLDDWDPNGKTYYVAFNYVFGLANENYRQVMDFDKDIAKQYDGGLYNYSKRKDIKALWDQYTALTDELKLYVSNYGFLEQMHNDCLTADALVQNWLDAVAKIDATGNTAKPVTVSNWDAVKTARDMFNKLDTGSYKGTSFATNASRPSEVVKTTTAYETTTYDKAEKDIWEKARSIYGDIDVEETTGAVNQLATLEGAFKKLNDDLTATTFVLNADLPFGDVKDWMGKFNPIKAQYEDLPTINGANPTDGKANQTYFQTEATYASAWTKYQTAYQFSFKYDAEVKIMDAWQACNGTDKFNEDFDLSKYDKKAFKVTYQHAAKINTAKLAYDAYFENTNKDPQKDTDKANIRNFKQLEKMLEDLAPQTATLDTWVAEVLHLVDPEFDAKTGDIWKTFAEWCTYDSAKKVVTTKFTGYPLDLDEYAKVLKSYTDHTAADSTKGEGPEDAAAKAQYYNDMGAKPFFDKIKELSDAAIRALKQDIDGIGTTVEANEIEKVQDIVTRYYELHPTQQAAVEPVDLKTAWEEFKTKADQNNTANAFNEMVKNLYEDVLAKTFDKGEAISGKTPNITSLTPYYVNAIKAIYAALDSVYQANCREAYNKLAEIEAAYTAEKDTLSLESLQAALDALDSKLTGEQNTLSGNLATLQTKVDAIKGEYEAAIKAAIDKALEDLKNGDLKTMNETLSKLQSDLTTKETELKGQISSLDSAIKDLQDKFAASEKADAELQSQIDALKKQSTGLMAGIIVVAIVAAALVACVAVLFIKRKSN